MDIAIIEDTRVNLLVMQRLVTRLGKHASHIFAEPESGLSWCLANAPDLIIVDYMMPDLDGLEFVRRCRAAEGLKDTPILMVTAATEREVRYAALEAGATDFLTKPIDQHEFCPRVRNMLQLRASVLSSAHRADELAAEVRKATAEILYREQETVARLAKAAEYRDPETGAHIQRMAHFSVLIGKALGIPEEELSQLFSAATMHDIGKLGTPDHILLKPGRLTPEELVIMRQHATIGYEILKDSASPTLRMAALIALSHHEKYDGTGYPAGKAGDAIPLVGRIVAVADVFDALTSSRSYKPAWPLEKAYQHLQEGRGKHFDPRCVDAFVAHGDEVLSILRDFADPLTSSDTLQSSLQTNQNCARIG